MKVSAILKDGSILIGGHFGNSPVTEGIRTLPGVDAASPWALSGVPHSFVQPTRPGDTGGATLHGFSPNMASRIYGTFHGNGRTHTVSVRTLPGQSDPTPG